ncbi:MAG TPA: serine/threonine-protein kinase [Vicinamibacteria bacterium]|nr:serine/threonine-protein kinase [Vicinamibacteria bacterium]
MLGRGSWSTVVRTRSRDAGRDVALKVLVNLDPELLERLREEVRAVQALATPYLVHTYSLFDRGAIAWFEMEVVDGPTLQQELDRLAAAGGRLPFVRACEIALAVSRCVWHAHRHGVLHRDIKPANVLLPVSGRPAAKLSDFGIARLADVSRATPPGAITGTPRFASPESLAGQSVGPAHDVYGLAITLYALFSGGRLPHDVPAGSSLALLRGIRLTERPAPLRRFAPEVEPRLEHTIMEGLSSDPAERPAARRVVLALERAQVRAVAALGHDAPGVEVSVSRLKIRILGLGSAVLRVVARLLKRRPGG